MTQSLYRSTPDPSVPVRIGRFRVERELGRGGQAIVYLATDERLGRRVALKVLTSSGPYAAGILARFEREARIASRLEHPGICAVHDAREVDGIAYIAMQYVEGHSLAELMRRSRERLGARLAFPLAEELPAVRRPRDQAGADHSATIEMPSDRESLHRLVRVIELAARALHAAHDVGIVHRDVKPANIMIDPTGQPIVLDFGMSRDDSCDLPSLTETGAVFGTPDYMSPEQVVGDRHRFDRRGDLFSLAIVLYECVTGQRPFARPTQTGVLAAIRDEDVVRPRKLNAAIPAALEAVLENALEKDPAHRYATLEEFADELERVRCSVPIRARALQPWERTWRWAQRNPRLASAVAIAALSLVTGLVVSLVLLRQRTDALAQTEQQRAAAERVADGSRLDDLLAEAQSLYPPLPQMIDRLESWLDRCDLVLARVPEHQLAAATATTANLSARDNEIERWQRSMNRAFLTRLPQLEAARSSTSARLDTAERIAHDTLDSHAAAWRVACAEIAADARFGGLELTPQLGLVPLGADLRSKLQEFAATLTGSIPARNPVSGELSYEPDSAIVLVLLPGGQSTIGAQAEDPSAARFSPFARVNTTPVHTVRLDPFWIAKHETTQAQWRCVMGANPSAFTGPQSTRLPVESVDWTDVQTFAFRAGLSLPTESQWEYACRAGTDTAFCCGHEIASLQGHANLLDQSAREAIAGSSGYEDDIRDGFGTTAPVGSFAANGFGLHDVHGNVWEWVQDYYSANYSKPRDGDGARDSVEQRFRVLRGGGFDMPAPSCDSSFRSGNLPDESYNAIGFRVARRLTTD